MNTIIAVKPMLSPKLFVTKRAISFVIPISCRTGLKIRLKARIKIKNRKALL